MSIPAYSPTGEVMLSQFSVEMVNTPFTTHRAVGVAHKYSVLSGKRRILVRTCKKGWKRNPVVRWFLRVRARLVRLIKPSSESNNKPLQTRLLPDHFVLFMKRKETPMVWALMWNWWGLGTATNPCCDWNKSLGPGFSNPCGWDFDRMGISVGVEHLTALASTENPCLKYELSQSSQQNYAHA